MRVPKSFDPAGGYLFVSYGLACGETPQRIMKTVRSRPRPVGRVSRLSSKKTDGTRVSL
jgi:hypothetical protein